MSAPGLLSPSSAGPERALAPWPRRATCSGCGDEILKAKLDLTGPGRPRILEVAEVVPAYPCGKCEGTGRVGPRHARRECPRCCGTRELGELVYPDEKLVAINRFGLAREITIDDRHVGDALHRPHICFTRPVEAHAAHSGPSSS